MAGSILNIAVETYVFFFFAGLFACALIVAATIPCLLTAPFLGGRRAGQLFVRAAMFIVLLHAFSLPANAVMAAALRDRLYYSADPVIDFLPYMPFSDWATDPACGGHLLNGFPESAFVAAWLALAIPVWLATVVAFRRLLPSLRARGC